MLISARSYEFFRTAECYRTYPSHSRTATAAWYKTKANRYDRRHPRDEFFCEVAADEVLDVEFVPAEVEQDENILDAYLAMIEEERIQAEREQAEQDAIFAHEMEGILPTWGEHFSPEDIQWGFSVRTRA